MMLLWVAVIAASTSCFGATISPNYKLRINGGEFSIIESAPYTAQFVQNSNLFCGATIINEYWLISAGHCLADKQKEDVTTYTGSTERIKGETHEIEKIIINPQFNPDTLDNDISLIKLTKPINFTEQQKSIFLSEKPPIVGSLLKISGYGRQSENDAHSPVMKIANVPIVNLDECRENYRTISDHITDSMFCAGNGTADSRVGDSGGPAVFNNTLVGVISAGQGCGSDFFFGIYTRIDLFRDWILNEISGNGTKLENVTNATNEVTDKNNATGTTVKPQDAVVNINDDLLVKNYYPNHNRPYAWVQANVDSRQQTTGKPYQNPLDSADSNTPHATPTYRYYPIYDNGVPQQPQIVYSVPECYNEQYRLGFPWLCQLVYLQPQVATTTARPLEGWFDIINSLTPIPNIYHPSPYWNNYYPASYDHTLDPGVNQQQQVGYVVSRCYDVQYRLSNPWFCQMVYWGV